MWPEPEPTQQLLLSARAGSEAAVNALLERHRQALRRLVDMRMDRALQRRVDASDVVQDVMIEAHRRLRDYLANSTMPFHLWLRHLARDRIIDLHRRHRVAAKRSLDRERPLAAPGGLERSTLELAAQLCDPQLTPAAEALWHEMQQRFAAALEQLSDEERELVQMRHVEQLSNSEVAGILGLEPPAASMRYLRVIRKLRALLAEPESNEGGQEHQTGR